MSALSNMRSVSLLASVVAAILGASSEAEADNYSDTTPGSFGDACGNFGTSCTYCVRNGCTTAHCGGGNFYICC